MAITYVGSRWSINSGVINNYSRGLHIFDQYESNEILTIEVGTCDECGECELADDE